MRGIRFTIKTKLLVLIAIVLVSAFFNGKITANAADELLDSGVKGMKELSADDIRELYKQAIQYTELYKAECSLDPEDFHPATMTEEAYGYALNYMNYIRRMCKLPYLTLNKEANMDAACAALLATGASSVNTNKVPEQPEGMADEDYERAAETFSEAKVLISQSADSSIKKSVLKNTIQRLVHGANIGSSQLAFKFRREFLSPTLKSVGIGSACKITTNSSGQNITNVSAAIKLVGDNVEFSDTLPDYDFIAWPASGNMMYDILELNDIWTVTLNPERYGKVDPSAVHITLTRTRDNAQWTFSKEEYYNKVDSSGRYFFHVSSDEYGVGENISFRPEEYLRYYNGEYIVEITGITDISGKETSIQYSVVFFPYNGDIGSVSYTVKLDCDKYHNTGEEIQPEVRASYMSQPLIEGVDYKVEYYKTTNGDYRVRVTGIGNYYGQKVLAYYIRDDVWNITYHHNNGTDGYMRVAVKDGGEYTIEGVDTDNKGRNFAGWAYTPDAKVPVFQPGDTITVNANYELYAIWREIPYFTGRTRIDIGYVGGYEEYYFVPEKDGFYTFIAEGDTHSYLNIYDEVGYLLSDYIDESDDNNLHRSWFLYKGEKYKLRFSISVIGIGSVSYYYADYYGGKAKGEVVEDHYKVITKTPVMFTSDFEAQYLDFVPAEDATFTIYATDTEDLSYIYGILYDEDRRLIADCNSGNSGKFSITADLTAGERYILRLVYTRPKVGSYSIQFKGGKVVGQIEPGCDIAKPGSNSFNIALDTSLLLTYHVTSIDEVEITKMYVSVNGEEYQPVSVTDAGDGGKNGTVSVAAAQMADRIRIKYRCHNKFAGTNFDSMVYTCSVEEYVTTLLAQGTSFFASQAEEQRMKKLAANILNYGAYAQKYFEYNTNRPANRKLSSLGYSTKVSTPDAGKIVKGTIVKNAKNNLTTIIGHSLVLDTELKLRTYISVDSSVAADKVRIAYTIGGESKVYAKTYQEDGYCYADIPIRLCDINKTCEYYFYVSGGSTISNTYSYNVTSYYADAKAKQSGKTLMDVLASLVNLQ